MKTLDSLPRVALLAFTLGTASLTAAFAQTPPSTPPPTSDAPSTPPPHQGHDPLATLTDDQKAEFQKAHDQVLADNPDLKTEDDALMKQHDALKAQGSSASPADKQAIRTQWRAHQDKLRAAMLKLDPNLGPVFAKMDAARSAMHNRPSQ